MSDRLPPIKGEWIDRSQVLPFRFEGMPFSGYDGDTVSSALWASGQHLLSRSFKYHRLRGILSFANHDVSTLMQNEQHLNLRGDITSLENGMNLTAVNTLGGLMSDRASILDFFSAFLPVGFYYKAFHQKQLFPLWERLIRHLTGLGTVDPTTPRFTVPHYYDVCDVLVIGGGSSGLAAALAAADAGTDVVIVDENTKLGGSGLYQRGGDNSQAEKVWELIKTVTNHDRIRVFTNTEAAGYYSDRSVPLVSVSSLTKIRAKAVIIASGAYEQPAVFHNNDLPGIMLGSAAQRLIYRYAVKPMQRAVVLAANSDGYPVALDLFENGVDVVAIADLRPEIPNSKIVQAVRTRNIPILPAHCIYEAKLNPATHKVGKAVICPIDAESNPQIEKRQSFACDGIVMSVGWAGAGNLLYQAGTKMQFNYQIQQFIPQQLPDGVFACGRVNGVFSFEQKLQDGDRAGILAAAYLGMGEKAIKSIPPELESPSHPWPIISHPQGKNFVDFDEDLQLKDFAHAVQEGFDNIELLKRYTTVGMSPSQGKHASTNAIRILAKLTDKSIEQVGTTTARPFFHPVPLSHLAGRSFPHERLTPLHDRHASLNAEFMRAGIWQRPAYYEQLGKSRQECIHSEVKSVRDRVGIIDVGTLGKLEIYGPDAALFLERIYTGKFANMKLGTTRYALMLDETGVIRDDGVVARLGAEHFYFTTTTSNAVAIYREIARLNQIWQLDCGIVNLTGARAAINLAGPRSRDILKKLTDIDLEDFPYLGVRQGTVANIPALLMRVGFVGELGYEIHVPADAVVGLWDALIIEGKSYGIAPFGVEAQRLLRLEKAHIIVGQDTDGLTTPLMANLDWALKLDKPYFIGQRSLQIMTRQSLKQKLVGFQLLQNYCGHPPEENLLIIAQGEIIGRVTSVSFSPTLGRYIGLAYLPPQLTVIGAQFTIRLADDSVTIGQVSSIPFYDPENIRQRQITTPMPLLAL